MIDPITLTGAPQGPDLQPYCPDSHEKIIATPRDGLQLPEAVHPGKWLPADLQRNCYRHGDGSPVQPAPVAGDAAPSTSFRSATVTQILDPRNADLRRKILCEKTRFYFEHHEFVENQILAEVTRVDGAHAAVSKTKMYYHSLAESMLTGSPMVFWPQISPATASNAAFDSQADLQEFVDHVRDLFLGKPDGYLKDAQARRLERPGRMAA
jgi:hypothetical protein